MAKRIIYERPEDGGVTIVIPAISGRILDKGYLEDVAMKSVPPGVPFEIVEDSAIPTDRTFRNAWKKTLREVNVDMPKARLMHMDKIRKVRDVELDKTDKEYIQNQEDSANPNELKARRRRLRDLPATFDLEIAASPEELKVLWPADLPPQSQQ